MRGRLLVVVALCVVFAMTFIVGCSNPGATDNTGSGSETSESEASELEASEPETGENDEIVIACVYDNVIDYMTNVVEGSEAVANDYEGVKVVVMDSQQDSAKQMQNLENAIAQKVDAIAIKLVDGETGPAMIEKSKAAGIPIVAVTTTMEGSDAFILTDNSELGRMQAEAMAEMLGGKGNVAILLGDPTYEFTTIRTDAVKEVLAEYPDIKIVAEQTANWMRDQGMTVMENWIQSGLQIDAILSNCDEMAIGAMFAAQNANYECMYAGADALETWLQNQYYGKLQWTALQDAYKQGYSGVEAAVKLARGEEVDPIIEVPFIPVTDENILEIWKDVTGTDEIPPLE
jgi:inositol transport system substrate-binding protein